MTEPRVERAAVDGIYVAGYETCTSVHLCSGDGTLVSRIRHGAARTLSLARNLPSDVFGVTVSLNAHDAQIRHGPRTGWSGRIPVGHASFQRPGQTIRTVTDGPLDVLLFYLPRTTIARVCAAADVPLDPDRVEFVEPGPGVEASILDLARRARREVDGAGAFARLQVESIAQDLVIHMLRRHSTAAGVLRGRDRDAVRGGLSPRQLRRALDAMEGMPEREVTLAALAAEAGCSPTHFSRAFRCSTGVAPFAWLLGRRIERASELLRDGDRAIAEVALAAGFSSQASFTTAFKRVTGITPGAWRRGLP